MFLHPSETAAEIRAATGAQVVPVRADVRQAADVDRFVQAAVDEFGRVDILITKTDGQPLDSWTSAPPTGRRPWT